jgi:hypothetical protein
MQRTLLVRNNTGLASGVAFSSDVDTVIVGLQAITANCIITNGNLSVADLTAPTSFNVTQDQVVFGYLTVSPLKIPISAGEVWYCRFSGNGSAVIILDDSLTAEIGPRG